MPPLYCLLLFLLGLVTCIRAARCELSYAFGASVLTPERAGLEDNSTAIFGDLCRGHVEKLVLLGGLWLLMDIIVSS